MFSDEMFMQRCLELAVLGLGKTGTNPLVGCVIVYDGQITGEGYHEIFGGAHAEVNAIQQVKNQALLQEATVYVSLEPCAHFGKTPPCADLLISKKVKRVVIAMLDPFPKVNGSGIRKLQDAGILAEVGVLEGEARRLNKRFLTYHLHKRPYVILKWVQSADGFISRKGERIPLSNDFSNRLVHRWRAEEAAILVGPDTAISDNPQLSTRNSPGKNPLRLLLDRNLRVPTTGRMFTDEDPLWIFNTLHEKQEGKLRYIKLEEPNFLQQVLQYLHEQGIASVLVEGGAGIHEAFLKEKLWDEIRLGVSPKLLEQGVAAPQWPGVSAEQLSIEEDTWYYFFEYLLPRSLP